MEAMAVFPQEKAVRLVDHPELKIGRPTEVKLRMLEVGCAECHVGSGTSYCISL